MHRTRMVLLDNKDSFTWNLADEFARAGAEVTVIRNDVPAEAVLERVRTTDARLVVISPGPGSPAEAGCCLAVVHGVLGRVPLLGVCLGHQALIECEGGVVSRAPAAVHGKAHAITHDGSGAFDGLPSPMAVGRYHSLAGSTVPASLAVTATTADGVVMGVSHRHAPALGVQFHPESVLTAMGSRMITNVLRWAESA